MTAVCLFELGLVNPILIFPGYGLLTSCRSLVCATAPSSNALIVGRAIAGMGFGGIFSGCIVILAYCCKFDMPFHKRRHESQRLSKRREGYWQYLEKFKSKLTLLSAPS